MLAPWHFPTPGVALSGKHVEPNYRWTRESGSRTGPGRLDSERYLRSKRQIHASGRYRAPGVKAGFPGRVPGPAGSDDMCKHTRLMGGFADSGLQGLHAETASTPTDPMAVHPTTPGIKGCVIECGGEGQNKLSDRPTRRAQLWLFGVGAVRQARGSPN